MTYSRITYIVYKTLITLNINKMKNLKVRVTRTSVFSGNPYREGDIGEIQQYINVNANMVCAVVLFDNTALRSIPLYALKVISEKEETTEKLDILEDTINDEIENITTNSNREE